MRHADTIDNINRARSEHLQGVVPQQNCSVLINTYTNHPGILRHGAQKSADASAFGEMLINDGIANEAQSGCHMEIAYAVRFPARSLYQQDRKSTRLNSRH